MDVLRDGYDWEFDRHRTAAESVTIDTSKSERGVGWVAEKMDMK